MKGCGMDKKRGKTRRRKRKEHVKKEKNINVTYLSVGTSGDTSHRRSIPSEAASHKN